MKSYDELTDQELTKAVAERLGWKLVEYSPCRGSLYGHTPDYRLPDGLVWQDVPNFATDIAAAWTLVEDAERRRWRRKLESLSHGYLCTFTLPNQSARHSVEVRGNGTAPRCICLAYLKLRDALGDEGKGR